MVDNFNVLKWMPIHYYFIYRKLVLAFTVFKNMTPEYLNVSSLTVSLLVLEQNEIVIVAFYNLLKYQTEF